MSARQISAVLAFVVALVACVPASAGFAAADASDTADTDAMVEAAVTLRRIDTELVAAARHLHEARQDLLATTASLNVTEGLLVLTRGQISDIETRVRARGVDAYTRHSSAAAAPLSVGRGSDFSAASKYVQASIDVDTEELGALRAVEEKQLAERAVRESARAAAVDALDAADREERALEAERADALARLDELHAVPVMGRSALTGPQLAGWFRSTGAVAKLAPGVTIDDIAALFVEEGDAEGVRGDLAFAQAIIETGSFGVAAGNNYSGIGVCDSCTGGYAFTDAREGVRAQIQLLRNYADGSSRATNLAHPPSPSLYGDDAAKAARLYDTFFLKGHAPVWNLMGNGNWATDPVYAPKVIGLYGRMMAWSAAHPTGIAP